MISSAEQLCSDHPDAFRKFTEFVLNMKFDEEPKYATCIALFQPLLDGPGERPIMIDSDLLKSVSLDVGAFSEVLPDILHARITYFPES